MKTFINKQKGYTLLFAIIVAILVLGVAAFILTISRKQFLLSSAARDSLYALYAADSGIECAIETENLSYLGDPKGKSSAGSINCGGMTQTVTWVHDAGGTDSNVGTSTFYLFTGSSGKDDSTVKTQSGAASCVRVEVGHWIETKPGGAQYDVTNVEARGYNIGWDSTLLDCSVSGPRKVERGLRYRLSSPV